MTTKFNIPKELIPSDPRFGCGPSLIPLSHLEKLADTKNTLLGTSHRKKAVKVLVEDVQIGFKKYFNLPEGYQVILGNGGASLLFDMIALNVVKKKVHHFTSGEFSTKWSKSSKLAPGIETIVTSVELGKGIDIDFDSNADTVCATLNETSTGVILDKIQAFGESTVFCVDATSGAGQVKCDVSLVDVFFLSPQKVFASEGGLWIAFLSPKALNRISQNRKQFSDRYIPVFLDFKIAIDNSLKHQTYNTPAASTLFFLNEQIKKLNQVGYDAVCIDATKKAELIYNWAEEKEYLSAFISEKRFRSTSVATIDVDEKIDVKNILKELDDDFIVHGIDSYRKLGRNQFRISMFFNNSYENLKKLTELLSYIIEEYYLK